MFLLTICPKTLKNQVYMPIDLSLAPLKNGEKFNYLLNFDRSSQRSSSLMLVNFKKGTTVYRCTPYAYVEFMKIYYSLTTVPY